MLSELENLGEQPVPQFAIDIFNADLALPDAILVVEMDGGAWHAVPKKRMQDARKDAVLAALGWGIVRIQCQSRMMSRLPVYAEDIRALAEVRRETEPVRRQNGVIARYPKPIHVKDRARMVPRHYGIDATEAAEMRQREVPDPDVLDGKGSTKS